MSVQPADDLVAFALLALDHAADSVLPSGGPLVPFALIERDGNRELTRFPGALTEGITKARQTVRASDRPHLAAVAWDEYLTVEGARTDAVYIEAFKDGDTESLLFAQRYGGSDRIGNPAIVGRGEQLF